MCYDSTQKEPLTPAQDPKNIHQTFSGTGKPTLGSARGADSLLVQMWMDSQVSSNAPELLSFGRLHTPVPQRPPHPHPSTPSPVEICRSKFSYGRSARLIWTSRPLPLPSLPLFVFVARHGDGIIAQSPLPWDASMHPPPLNKQHQMTKGCRAAQSERKHGWGVKAGVGMEGERGGWKIKTGKLKEERPTEKAWERNINSWTRWMATELFW